MNRIAAVVGMCGSGKSVACDVLKFLGWKYIRFGQMTMDRLVAQGKAITPENEKRMREALREEYGMGAYAWLSLPVIDEAISEVSVVIDGLYSWSEYKILKNRYPDSLEVIHIYASPRIRYQRLSRRTGGGEDRDHRMRVLSIKQAQKRDYAEIENIEKGGPIAMADFTVINEGTVEEHEKRMQEIVQKLQFP